MVKRKRAKSKKPLKRRRVTQKKHKVSEDTAARKKYARGGRIEAYTFGEAQHSKSWP